MIRWKRAKDDYVESHCGTWQITPNYWSCVRPQSFSLQRKVEGRWIQLRSHCATQREAKGEAAYILGKEKS